MSPKEQKSTKAKSPKAKSPKARSPKAKPVKAAPEWANHPGLEGLKVKDDYYLVDENGVKYDGALLAKAVDIITTNPKGNLLVADVKALYDLVVDANVYTETEQRTVQFIRSRFKFTPASEKKLVSMLEDWEAKHGIKPDAKTAPAPAKTKAPAPPESEVARPMEVEAPATIPAEVPLEVESTVADAPEPESEPETPEFIDEAPMTPARQRYAPAPRTKAVPGESKGGKEEVYKAPEEVKTAETEGPVNPMRRISIAKVVANIGVGEAGEKLLKAESVLTSLTGAKPVRTISRSTNRDLGIRKGAPLGCKVTLRGEIAAKLLREALWVRENRIFEYSISRTGCLSFGIPDYTSFPDQKYDPDIGIFGLDLSVVLQRPGHRVKDRRLNRSKLGRDHKITREEARDWLVNNFQVEVVT